LPLGQDGIRRERLRSASLRVGMIQCAPQAESEEEWDPLPARTQGARIPVRNVELKATSYPKRREFARVYGKLQITSPKGKITVVFRCNFRDQKGLRLEITSCTVHIQSS